MNQGSVLVVDDSEIDRYIICRQLAEIGDISVIEKVDGLKALEYLKVCLKEQIELPKVIILDINMPMMGGFEFLQTIAQYLENDLSSSAIFMHSSSDRVEDLTRANKFSNVKGYFIKGATTPLMLKDELTPFL